MGEIVRDIQGAKVILRQFKDEHITPVYLAWLHDEEVLRFSNQRFKTHTAESSRAYLASFNGTPNLFLAIFSKDGATMVGTMTAYINEHHQTADIGILIGDRNTWGKGFGGDAWNTLLEYLLKEKKLRKITGGTLSGNKGMISVMERSGMKLEATRKDHEIVQGTLQDVLYFARFGGE